jgi:diguanylate cyclase (GGDEF)-like protein
MTTSRTTFLLSIIAPLVFIVIILTADVIEGTKTAYVGILATVPMFAAVFGTIWSTAIISVITVLAGWIFGLLASDGNAPAQSVRLIIISIVGVVAIYAVRIRQDRERSLAQALLEASFADQMRILAETDQLTELWNRRGLISRVENYSPRERTLVIIDIDNLKSVNDEFGHLVGDRYLKAIAGRVAGAISKSDLFGRWGGDEFLVVLDATSDSAQQVLERVRNVVIRSEITTGSLRIPASFSAGAATWVVGESIDEVLRRADAALYSAKAQGRNKSVFT